MVRDQDGISSIASLRPSFFNLQSVTFNGFGGPFFGQDGNFYQFFSLDNIDVIGRPVSVPEPSPLSLFATGLFAWFFAAWRFANAQFYVPTRKPRTFPDRAVYRRFS